MKKKIMLKEGMFDAVTFFRHSFYYNDEPEFVETISPGYDVYKTTTTTGVRGPGARERDRFGITYLLLNDSPLFVDPQVIGIIEFVPGPIDTVNVWASELGKAFRGKGIGRMLYKATVNDLLKTYRCVQSDTTRSLAAEGVWKSFCRVNPVKKVESAVGESRYQVHRPLRRRPVRVRSHRRKQ